MAMMGPTSAAESERRVPRGNLLRDQAYENLKSLILSGQLGKMPFLSARSLAQQLEMSATPVRSAVERLEAEGFLSIGPQRGITLRELTTEEIADQYELRQALESLVLRKLAGKLKPEQKTALRENLAAHEASLKAKDVQEYIALDGDFHLLLAEFCGNADVERVLRQLRDRIYRVVLRVIEHMPGRVRKSIAEHRRIVTCLETGDADGAVAVLTEHLRGGLKALVPSYREEEIAF